MSIASRITSIEGHIGDIYDSVELTGVDTTDIDKNLVNVPNTLKEGYIDIINNGTDTLYNNFPKVSGEGTSLTLNNTYQAPMRNNLKGNTSQTGTPTPTSPTPVNVVSGDNSIVVCGKNLFNKNTCLFTNGKRYNDNGSIVNDNDSSYSDLISVLPNTTYTISNLNGVTGKTVRTALFNKNKTFIQRTTSSATNNITITTTNETYYLSIQGRNTSDFDINSVQMEIGQATTYEPYIGNTYNIDLPVENLYKVNDITTTTKNGVTYSVENEVITLNGTVSSGFDIVLSSYYPLEAGTYTISCQVISGSYTGTIGKYVRKPSGSGYTILIDGSSLTATRTVTVNESNENTYSALYLVGGAVCNNLKVSIQLEKGTKQNNFTPYGTTPIELCKIGNYQDGFGKSDGTQLFDKDNANKLDCLLNGQNGSIANYSGAKLLYIPCESSTTYTISKIKSARFVVGTSSSTPSNGVSCSVYQANNDATSITITSGTSDKYLAIFYYLSSADTLTEQQILDSIMINEGSSATPWQPYGVGKWYLHKEIGKVVLNGSENISIYNQNTNRTNFQVDILTGIENYSGGNNVPNLLSNMFNVVSQSATWTVGNISRRRETQTTLYLTYKPNTTVEAFKTWLASNNVSCYYIYATPTNTEITYQPLIDQLNLLEKAMSKENQTNISQVNNDLGFIISASALKKG